MKSKLLYFLRLIARTFTFYQLADFLGFRRRDAKRCQGQFSSGAVLSRPLGNTNGANLPPFALLHQDLGGLCVGNIPILLGLNYAPEDQEADIYGADLELGFNRARPEGAFGGGLHFNPGLELGVWFTNATESANRKQKQEGGLHASPYKL